MKGTHLIALWAAMQLTPTTGSAADRTVAAALRNTGTGWAAIADRDHAPIGVASVSNDGKSIRVKFTFTAKKIHSFIVSADETYATTTPLVCGASVGMAEAFIQCSRGGSAGPVNPNDLTLPNGNLWIKGTFSD